MTGSPQATATGWALLPTIVVRSAGFGWQLVDGLRHGRSAVLLDVLCEELDRAEAVRAGLPPGPRLPRGLAARVRNLRPLPAGGPVPDGWRVRWNAATEAVAQARQAWEAAAEADEQGVAEALAAFTADPRVRDALVCSGPGVFRDLVRTGSPPARLRRQLASYAQRLATKCETMSFFGPVNYAVVDPGLHVPAVGAWKGPAVCARREAFLSAWAFRGLLDAVLAEPVDPAVPSVVPAGSSAASTGSSVVPVGKAVPAGESGGSSGESPRESPGGRRLVDGVVPRRSTFASVPRGEDAAARLVRAVDGTRTLAELAGPAGLTPAQARQALDDAVRQGRLGHDLIPPAVHPDPTRWLAERLECLARQADSSIPAASRHRLSAVLELLDAYPAAAAETKLALQEELRRLVSAAPGRDVAGAAGVAGGAGAGAAGVAGGAGAAGVAGAGAAGAARGVGSVAGARGPKFYNDRVVVTEAASGTLELALGGELATDLDTAVPAALDLLVESATRTRQRAAHALASTLGPGRFPLLQVLHEHGNLPATADPWLPTALATLITDAGTDATDLDLAELLPAPAAPDLPVLASADVMVAVPDLADYRAGQTLLVVGDVHDAALLTPWALQFHPDAARILAGRDAAIEHALASHRAVGVIARRSTGLPPLRFPGPVVELGTVDDPAERLPLDRLLVHSDGEHVRLQAAGDRRDLVLHNGELDSFVHTALALPRLRPLPVPDLARIPRLRHGNVVLARRRWRLHPGPLTELTGPPRTAGDRLALRRALRDCGVPDRFFAKASHQRKPLYVDADSPLLVEALFRLLAGADRLYASEVVPGPDDLWLREGGVGVAAELRCVYVRRPQGRPGEGGSR